MSITAHCLVKNEENFIWYSIESIVDYVDKIIVFDTGSEDKTVEIVSELVRNYPGKIIFEEKGICDKKKHTQLRQEMIDRTKTDWFMVLDGDEVWTSRGIEEALKLIKEGGNSVGCLIAPFYLCVGDVFHKYYKKGAIEMLGQKDFFYPRIFKMINGIHWSGDYNNDVLVYVDGAVVFQKNSTVILKNRFWHMTHLRRSSQDDKDFSSYGSRKQKRRETYFILGRKIKDAIPEVFIGKKSVPRLGVIKSFVNFIRLVFVNLKI